MSLAPRPNNLPSRCVGVNGSLVHCCNGPVGTTSTCPANANVWPEVPALLAQRLRTRKWSGPKSMMSQLKPMGSKCALIKAVQPPSSGVTEGREISCSVKRSVALMMIFLNGQSAQFDWPLLSILLFRQPRPCAHDPDRG